MSFSETDLRNYNFEDYNEEIEEELDRRRSFLVTPNCCKSAKKFRSIFLRVDLGYYYNLSGSNIHVPVWHSKECPIPIKYCHFCGKKLPSIVPVKPPGPIVVCKDGGYYCDTCGHRLDSCRCFPPESAWGIEGH